MKNKEEHITVDYDEFFEVYGRYCKLKGGTKIRYNSSLTKLIERLEKDIKKRKVLFSIQGIPVHNVYWEGIDNIEVGRVYFKRIEYF